MLIEFILHVHISKAEIINAYAKVFRQLDEILMILVASLHVILCFSNLLAIA